MTSFRTFILFLASLFVLGGCTTVTEPQNHLTVSKEEICLHFNGADQCVKSTGTFRLTLNEGKPKLEQLDLGKMNSEPSYPQYNRPVSIKTEKLGVIIDNKVLSLQIGEQTLKDSTGLGFLFVRAADGGLSCMAGANPILGTQILEWNRVGELKGTTAHQIQLSANLLPNFMTLSRIQFAYGDAAMHLIPNDTGTEVVIIDNFKVVGSCDAEPSEGCCADADSPGPPITVDAAMTADYAADGLRLLACFPVNSICTFTDGDKLIVYDCITQERDCLDYSLCDVYITTTDAGICISVPSTCEIENPFL